MTGKSGTTTARGPWQRRTASLLRVGLAMMLTVGVIAAGRGYADSAHGNPGPVAPTPDARLTAQATAMRSVLTASSSTRGRVINAVNAVAACHSVRTNANTLKTAITTRHTLYARAKALDVTAMPGGAELRSALVSALDLSYRADKYYSSWAGAHLSQCSTRTVTTSGSYRSGNTLSVQATSVKLTFVARWNSAIAPLLGWPPLRETDI